MTEQKQIEEMAHELCGVNSSCEVCRLDKMCLARNCADILCTAGYRKQSEGEWVRTDWGDKLCSCCNTPVNYMSNFCPNCGARMKTE